MKRRRRPFRRIAQVIVLFLVLGGGFMAYANNHVLDASRDRIYTDFAKIPHHRVGIVLGCAPTIRGSVNPFFNGRINAAFQLYKQGKVERLLVSGDNGSASYDEPTAMEAALVVKGVPASHIVKDFAGFRTLDSMLRARKIFGLTDATVVTDDFHMARSLYFASGAGIAADGYPSVAANNPMTSTVEFREILARARAVLDLEILHSGPKFLGKPEPIP